ncbi:phosphate ABC transporter permease [Chryseobacterium sp. RP-3-3]|uniref:Phosphate ABC transporter permease n=1 Tax=Chryseobacterium antibioticum TaxID=2728847 RepID=A0A7Y0AR13_9FLAO|nr:phosphate ABC transporter permease [Chryseobacterium antibioticum]NML71935.1 phosphate ABC transporter permease [Chryseobacterium antibioticum]
MKNFFLITLLIGFSDLLSAQKKQERDIWSGTYLVNEINNKVSTITDTLVMSRIKDASPKEIPAKEESDLARWSMTSKRDGGKDKITVKQFLFDVEDDEDGYKEFGWTDLHKEGKMNCIDGGHFFICQTQPNTTVMFGKDESYFTKTGIFGIWLHYGVVELQKR